jgi:hypothetical protein
MGNRVVTSRAQSYILSYLWPRSTIVLVTREIDSDDDIQKHTHCRSLQLTANDSGPAAEFVHGGIAVGLRMKG